MAKAKTTRDDDKALISSLLKKFKDSENKTTSYYKRWDKYYELYRSAKKYNYNDYKDKRVLPIAFSTIMSILPRIMSLKPEVRYIMRKMPNYIEDIFEKIQEKGNIYGYSLDMTKLKQDAVNYMDYIIQWQWDKFHGDAIIMQNILTSLIYGTSILRAYWDSDKNAPHIENIEPYYFFPDSSATSPFNMTHCFIKNYMNFDSFKELVKSGYFKLPDGVELDNIKSTTDPMSTNKDVKVTASDGTRLKDNVIEIVEYYDKKEYIFLWEDKIIRRVKNHIGMIPVVVNYNYILPNEFFGMSEIDQIEQFIIDMSDFRAMRHTNIELSSNLMWRIDPSKDVSLKDIVSAPGQIIPAEAGALEPIIMPQVPQGTYQEDSILQNDIRETSGISDYMRGGTPQRFETATAIDSLIQSGNARINMRVMTFVEYLIKPLGELIIELNKKFLKPMVMTVKEQTGIRTIIIPNELIKLIDTDYDIITIPTSIDKTRKEEFIQFMQIVMQTPQMAQKLNIDELLKNMFKMWDIPIYGLFKTDEQIKDEQQQAQEQQLAQMAQQQQQGGQINEPQSEAPQLQNIIQQGGSENIV